MAETEDESTFDTFGTSEPIDLMALFFEEYEKFDSPLSGLCTKEGLNEWVKA